MQVKPKQRRRHSAAFKAGVLVACAEPGASIAAVALAFKLNETWCISGAAAVALRRR